MREAKSLVRLKLAQKNGNSPARQCGDVQVLPTSSAVENFPNPTNSSWWIVQVQPTKATSQKPRRLARSSSEFSFVLPREASDAKRQIRGVVACRSDLNNPPTAVGWDSDTLQTLLSSR